MGCQLILSSVSSHWEDLHASTTWFDGVESNTISFLNKKLLRMTQEHTSEKKQYGSHFKFKSISNMDLQCKTF